MSPHTPVRRLAVLAAVLTAAAAIPSAARQPGFAWPGTYDLVGQGFPEGERRAVMHVERQDTAYVLTSLEGPPGRLVRARFHGDSAEVLWDMGATGGGAMHVWMRGAGDSLTGAWTMGDQQGELRGRRRP